MILRKERLREILDYNPLTGLFNYKVSRGNKKAGSIAGSLHKDNGYIQIRIDGKLYYAHKLAVLYTLGKFPEDPVKHLNSIKDDNRWENLVTTVEKSKFRVKIGGVQY